MEILSGSVGTVQYSVVGRCDLPPLPPSLLQWLAHKLAEKEA